MGLKATVDKLEDLEPSQHEFYKKDDKSGKFVLDVEEVDTLPRVRALKDESAQNRIRARDAEKNLEPFKALGDPTKVREQLDRIPELEALADGKVDDKKIELLVEGRIKSKLAPIERERDEFKTKLAEAEKAIEGFTTERKHRTVADAVRAAAGKVKVVDTAIEDVQLLAERVFDIAEDGSVVTKDNVGVTPGIAPDVWLTEMQTKRPHWFPASAGGGASGSRAGSGGVNPWSADGWNMTEQAKVYRENPTRAAQMAKAAGTSIGGQRPQAKK